MVKMEFEVGLYRKGGVPDQMNIKYLNTESSNLKTVWGVTQKPVE